MNVIIIFVKCDSFDIVSKSSLFSFFFFFKMNYISSSLSEAENSDGVEILSQSSQKLKAEELFVVD